MNISTAVQTSKNNHLPTELQSIRLQQLKQQMAKTEASHAE
jgi:hypothetical protein